MLIGIGESHEDRVQTLSDIADIAREYQHIQEVILQPYSPASDKMARKRSTATSPTININGNTPTTTTNNNNNDNDNNDSNNNRWFDISELPQLVLLARDILPADVVIQIPPNLILNRSSDRSGDSCNDSSSDRSDSSAGLDLLHQCLLAGMYIPTYIQSLVYLP